MTPLTLRRPRRSGFTLIEIVLAIGIVSFALVGIMGLFPVALDSALSSQQETQIALIAKSIFSEASAAPASVAKISTAADATTGQMDVDLTAKCTFYLGYDADGGASGTVSAGAYASGKADIGYIARIDVAPVEERSDLSMFSVTIECPASAPKEKRRAYPFASILEQHTSQESRFPEDAP